MSDAPQQGPMSAPPPGPAAMASQPPPGWWLAADGRWYPPPQPGGPAYMYQQPWQVQRGTNGLAVASLVLGILWLFWIGSVLAVIFGHVARKQIRDTGGTQSGAGMALAGLILGCLGVGLFFLPVLFTLRGA